jgi:hypothetical protein
MGAQIFWGMIIPSSFFILLIFGHETWRRICPLSFISQLPKALGFQRRRKVQNASGKLPRYEAIKISKNSWLSRNVLYVQFGLLFIGLNIRLLLINSDRLALGIYLILVILASITVGYLYGGKTWCHYFCPMAPVQMIFTGPRGLLGSQAHLQQQPSITQSMCREVDKVGKEKSVCVSCQSPCIDIDAERAYWDGITHRDRKLLYYGYLGLATGFYLYFVLYSGNWNYLAQGVWIETNQWITLWKPGLYLFNHAIPIPKIASVPLVLTLFTAGFYSAGLHLEKTYTQYCKKLNLSLSTEQIQHTIYSCCTLIAFYLIFFVGIRPTLGYVSDLAQHCLDFSVVVTATAWFYRTIGRTSEQYKRERFATTLRNQLKKLDIDFSRFLKGSSLDKLRPDEVYVLAKILPELTREKQTRIYKAVLEEALSIKSKDAAYNLEVFKNIRHNLNITEISHRAILTELATENPSLLNPYKQPATENQYQLGELLIHRKLISRSQLDRALAEQQECGQLLGELLVKMNVISEAQLVRVVMEQNLRQAGLWVVN